MFLRYRKLATVTHPERKPYPLHPENPPEGCEENITHLPSIPSDVCWQYVNEAYDVLSNIFVIIIGSIFNFISLLLL